jgi:AcrR family transcriptional regulator
MAGMSPAAMYVHYPTKERLLHEIVLATATALIEQLNAAYEDEDDSPDQLAAIVHTLVKFHATLPSSARIANYELHCLTRAHLAEILALRDKVDEIVDTCLGRGLSAGYFRIEDIFSTRTALLSLAISIPRWYSMEGPMTPEELGGLYTRLAFLMVSCTRGISSQRTLAG